MTAEILESAFCGVDSVKQELTGSHFNCRADVVPRLIGSFRGRHYRHTGYGGNNDKDRE